MLVVQMVAAGDLGKVEVGATPASHWKPHLLPHQRLATDLRGTCYKNEASKYRQPLVRRSPSEREKRESQEDNLEPQNIKRDAIHHQFVLDHSVGHS